MGNQIGTIHHGIQTKRVGCIDDMHRVRPEEFLEFRDARRGNGMFVHDALRIAELQHGHIQMIIIGRNQTNNKELWFL